MKAVRLRGELSQGIVCLPTAVYDVPLTLDAAAESGRDYAELLGITKWVPPVPVNMSGRVDPAPNLISWYEIENIKRYPASSSPASRSRPPRRSTAPAACC